MLRLRTVLGIQTCRKGDRWRSLGQSWVSRLAVRTTAGGPGGVLGQSWVSRLAVRTTAGGPRGGLRTVLGIQACRKDDRWRPLEVLWLKTTFGIGTQGQGFGGVSQEGNGLRKRKKMKETKVKRKRNIIGERKEK